MATRHECHNSSEENHERSSGKQAYEPPILKRYESPELRKHEHYKDITLLPPTTPGFSPYPPGPNPGPPPE